LLFKYPIIDYSITNDNLCKFFEWDKKPSIEAIIGELEILLSFIDRPDEDSNTIKENENYIYSIYEYLNNKTDDYIDSLKKELSEKEWILNESNIYSTKRLVFTLPTCIKNTEWIQVSKHNKEHFSQLLEKLGVKPKLEILDYVDILKSLNIECDNVIEILEYLSKEDVNLEDLLIPNMHGVMKVRTDIFFNDINKNNEELIEKHRDILTHHKITSELAKRLKIKNFNENFFLKNKMFGFDVEILTSRFIDTLKAFNCDIAVFQEFLKNADDASATQFCVILDYNDYRGSNKSLMKEEMNDWQGPSIWIFNDKQFSENDFKSIINVDCNKKPNKIGKEGLGFISCYNLTDLPQLISSNKIVFFDPQKKFLPNNKCGSVFCFDDYRKEGKSHFINMFEDQFEPYLKLNRDMFKFDFNDKEYSRTLFRLPLRTTESKISDKKYSVDDIKNILHTLKGGIASHLIFLRNIETFEVYEKRCSQNEELLWKVEVKENSSNRKFFGQGPQEFQLDIQLTERNYTTEIVKWLICSDSVSNDKSIPSDTWGGVAISISDIYNELYLKGRYYSYLPLQIFTELSVNLHSNNWLLTPGRSRFNWNDTDALDNILGKVLPQIHVKLLTEYIKYIEKEQKKVDWQFISELCSILENERSLAYKYVKKVLKLICEGTYKIFWSPSEGGSYISFRQSCFIDKNTSINVTNFLNENGYCTVLLDREHLEKFEKLGFTPQKVNPQFVRDILKNKKFVLDPSNLELSCSLLGYILDELYEELAGIRLVPLFGNRFGEFGKNYYIVSSKQFELFPKVGPNYFISIEKLEEMELDKIFMNERFLEVTNIKKFTALTIKDLLIEELGELNDGLELNWNPSSQKFRIKKIYNLSNPDQHKLISLINAKHRPLLVYSNNAEDINIVQKLVNLGIRFTKHQYRTELDDYILKALKNNNEAKEIMCQYFCKTLTLNNIVYTFILKRLPILKSLPIWPTHTVESANTVYRSVLDSNTYLIPTPFTFQPLNECRTYYYNTKYPNMRKLLEFLKVKERTKLDYIKDAIVPSTTSIPQHVQDDYLKFLIDIFSDNNFDEIKNYIKELEIFPNQTFKFCRAKDLFDQNNLLFKNIFEFSDKLFINDLQNNQEFIEKLKEMGLKSNITPEIFIECSEEIQANFKRHEHDVSKISKIMQSAKLTVDYFYQDQSELKFPKDKWNKLSKIRFIPISKNLEFPHSYNDEDVLNNYSGLGLPTIPTIINHLITIQETVSKSVEWRNFDKDGKQLFEAIKQVYEKLSKPLVEKDEKDEKELKDLSFCFPKDKPLFLNSTNPFDSESWVVASQLVLNIKNNFSYKRRAVNPYLQEYKEFLSFAGAGTFEVPHWGKSDPIEKNSQQLSKSVLEFLKNEDQTPFNNVLFRVGYEKQKNLCKFININIRPNSFKVLLNWLYGEIFSEAIKSIESDELFQIYEDLLLASEKFELESLKELIESNLVKYIYENLTNNTLKTVKGLADKYILVDLLNYYNPYIQHNKEIINTPLQPEKRIFDAPTSKKQERRPKKLYIGNAYSSNIDFEVAEPIIVKNSTIPDCDRFRMRRVKVDSENNPFVNWKIMPNLFEVPKNYYARCTKTETVINGKRIRIDGFSVVPMNMDSDAFFEMEIELNEGFSYCVFNYQEEDTIEDLKDQDKVEIRDDHKFDENTNISQDKRSYNGETPQIKKDEVNNKNANMNNKEHNEIKRDVAEVEHLVNNSNSKSSSFNEKIRYVLKGSRFVPENDITDMFSSVQL
ncbi:2721_t:CDS:2, partial [Scutellospora calospora]